MSFFNFTSGIFGSPPREAVSRNNLARSPSSPFCTSPSQLQEVTLDQDGTFSSPRPSPDFEMANEYLMAVLKNNVGECSLPSLKEGDGPSSLPSFCPSSKNSSVGDVDEMESHTMGIRSPSGPMRGRTVKEFEEQLTNLKKENFNLKLRIYFLEEKMGTNFTLDKDNIVKKNIELQVEIAHLQKEVKEKHELLCQAVKAIEVEEDEHRKYSQNQEEQMMQLQQEMADLRLQLQEVKFIESPKSFASSAHSEQERCYVPEFIPEMECRERRYADDGDLLKEKHQNQLASFVYDNTENLKQQIESLEKECQCRDQTIESLNFELTSANERLIDFAQQVKEYEEKLAAQHLKNGNLLAKMQEDQKVREKLKAQLASLNQKYSMAKFDFDQEREEIHRDKKAVERTNLMLDMRVSVLENENRKQKDLLKEQQAKVEAAVVEAKKNQNLAVSTSPDEKPSASNTDDRFISAAHPATPDGAAQENPLHVQIKHQGQQAGKRKSPSSKALVPPTPDDKNLLNFEKLLTECGGDRETIRTEFDALKADFGAKRQKIVKLKSEQLKACEIIKNMIEIRNKANDEIAQLKRAKEELERELENVVSKPQKEKVSVPLQTRVSELNITARRTPPCEKSTMADDKSRRIGEEPEIAEQYKKLAVELEAKIEVLVETLKEKDAQMQYIRTKYDEILNTLEEKENKIIDLEFELISTNQHSGNLDRSVLEKGDAGTEKRSSFYKRELEEKNREIERLNGELKKCTCYLQEIVNKELWAKNREIEKMHKKQESVPEVVVKLRKELSGKDLQLKLLKEKIDELGLDIQVPSDDSSSLKDLSSPKRNLQNVKALQEQLKMAKEERKFFEQRIAELESARDLTDRLRSEKESVRLELEKSEGLRLETNEVCSVLSGRLEELAIFLDSLLKQKSVLGFLGSAKNKRLREIISNSLDMSRSFTMSLMVNPEQSLAQLSNITALLNGSVFQELSLTEEGAVEAEEETHLSIVPDHVSLTYESHLYKKGNGNQAGNEEVIAALREQVFNLKSELQVRDNELNRLQRDKESGVERLSQTEPDEKPETVLTPKSTSATLKLQRSEGQSESEAWSEPDRAVSRARIGLNRSIPPSYRTHHCESTEEDDMYHSLTPSKKRSALLELGQDVYRLQTELEEKSEEIVANSVMYRQKLQEMDKEMQESKEKLEQAELERNSALKKVENLQKTVEELTAFKTQYEENMVGKDKEMQDKINRLEAEKHKVLMESQACAQQVIDAKNQVIAAQEKVTALEDKMEKMDKELRKEYEENLIAKLKNAEEVFTKQIKAVEEQCRVEIRIAQESLQSIREQYSKDFIRKVDVEKKLSEAEAIMTQLPELKSIVHSYEQTISSYKEKEKDIQENVQQYQDDMATLRADLEGATLRCCRAEQENAKIIEEKEILEQEIAKVSQKEQELRSQLNDIQTNLAQVTEKYGEQVLTLQKQKDALELKISELESCNAELHNRLIKAQTSRFSLGLNATLPPHVGSSKLSYRRQYSDQNTYSSEDNGDDQRCCFGLNRLHQANASFQAGAVAEAERAEANSSPDLGIESDHGRFSSLETNGNHVPRPLLQTIELTESMNNLFDGQNNEGESNTSAANEHCCQKSVEIAQENNELKRKLLRMKRALEETATQLNLANQRKKQVEKTICKQIHKTSQVLRKAKANLDSGSESDVFRM